MNERTEWRNLTDEELGGGIYYAQDSRAAAEYVNSRRGMHSRLIKMAVNWAERSGVENMAKMVQYFGEMSELVTDMFTSQLFIGGQAEEKKAWDVVPEIAAKLDNHLRCKPDYMHRYGPLLEASRRLLYISGPIELSEMLKELESCTYDLYCEDKNLPLPIVLGSQDSHLGQIEWEMYCMVPNYEQEERLAQSKKKIDQLHGIARKTARPMVGELLFAGGWGVGSVACGQALQNAQTFYLFPKSMKEIPMARTVMKYFGREANKAEDYLAKIYVMHEHGHVYYPDLPMLYSEMGPDLNVMDVMLCEAIKNPSIRLDILSIMLAAYSKDVFFSDGDELMQAYQSSSAVVYGTLAQTGLLVWNDKSVWLNATDKNLIEAVSVVRGVRNQLHRSNRCEVPQLPMNLDKAFTMLGLPVN